MQIKYSDALSKIINSLKKPDPTFLELIIYKKFAIKLFRKKTKFHPISLKWSITINKYILI